MVPVADETQAEFTLKLKTRVFQSNDAVGESTYSYAPQKVQSSAGARRDRARNGPGRRRDAGRVYFEAEDARVPVERRGRGVDVFVRAPEGAIVRRVDEQRAVVAPAAGG